MFARVIVMAKRGACFLSVTYRKCCAPPHHDQEVLSPMIEPRRSDEPKLSFDEWVAELRVLYAEKLMSAKRRENKAVGPCPKCGVCGPSDFTVQEPVEALWCCGTERIDDGTIIQSDRSEEHTSELQSRENLV